MSLTIAPSSPWKEDMSATFDIVTPERIQEADKQCQHLGHVPVYIGSPGMPIFLRVANKRVWDERDKGQIREWIKAKCGRYLDFLLRGTVGYAEYADVRLEQLRKEEDDTTPLELRKVGSRRMVSSISISFLLVFVSLVFHLILYVVGGFRGYVH